MRSKITFCNINEGALSLGPRLSLFSEVSYSSRAQQRSYSIYAVFLKYTKIVQVKERFCWQDIEGVVIIKLRTDRANAKQSASTQQRCTRDKHSEKRQHRQHGMKQLLLLL